MAEPQVQWIAPISVWPNYLGADSEAQRAQVNQPHLLRFATDSFMAEFMTMLQHQSERLHEWIAQPEEWQAPSSQPGPIDKLPRVIQRLHRVRLATALPLERLSAALAPLPSNGNGTRITASPPSGNLKLYQPGHMRFYLITACLVCRLPGLPDRLLDFGSGERVSYVIRRLRPKATRTQMPTVYDLMTCDEYAFVNGNEWTWVSADQLLPNEEINPLFGVSYVERDGRKRRLLAGVIPVGKRETYLNAAAARIVPDDELSDEDLKKYLVTDARVALFKRTISEPWRSLYDQSKKIVETVNKTPPAGQPTNRPDNFSDTARNLYNLEAEWPAWLILLDFSRYIEKYLPRVWDVMNNAPHAEPLNEKETSLLTALQGATYQSGGTTRSLAEALIAIREFEEGLENETRPYLTESHTRNTPSENLVWPDFIFRLNVANDVDPHANGVIQLVGLPRVDDNLNPDNLDHWIAEALPHDQPAATPPLPLAAQIAAAADRREEGWFVIRCVFERPNCTPPVRAVISEATPPFQMAAFFDPQAPARPIQVNLPLDITPAGLRKFDRNTAFVVSDALCKQINRMGNITLGDLVLSVLPWPFHKDLSVPSGEGACQDGGIDFGMICSLSIPIITICALILLIIMVSLLDLIFHWLPFFIICFPVPKLKAKAV